MRPRQTFDIEPVERELPRSRTRRPGSPDASRIWRRLAIFAAVVMALLISSVLRAEPQRADPPAGKEAQRFAVKADLQPRPTAIGDHRFSVRGTLEPTRPQRALEGVGFALKTALTPKGGALCFGPGHIFASGFEPLQD
jgi:hypothetical protein